MPGLILPVKRAVSRPCHPRRMDRDRYMQQWKGTWRVRVPVAARLRPYLDHPRSELVRTTGTANYGEAYRIAQPIITEFLGLIERAEDAADGMDRGSLIDRLRPQLEFLSRERDFDALGSLLDACKAARDWFDGKVEAQSMKPADSREVMPWDALVDFWAAETKAASVDDFRSKAKRLAAFLGYDDARRVSDADMVRYKEDLIASRLKPKTVDNHLTALRRLFAYGLKNKKITINPMADLEYKLPPKEDRDQRRDFTPGDQRAMLAGALASHDPAIKWPTLIAIYAGAREAEIVEADTRDVYQLYGRWVFHIRLEYRPRTMRIKTVQRIVPLPKAVIDAGFLDYVGSLPPGPLFPMIELDSEGRRAKRASRKLNEWLRDVGKITDPRKVFHCHRHTVKSMLRDLGCPEDVNDAITGHANPEGGRRSVGRDYGSVWVRTMARWIDQLRPGEEPRFLPDEEIADAAE
jgi:hypothetical protein